MPTPITHLRFALLIPAPAIPLRLRLRNASRTGYKVSKRYANYCLNLFEVIRRFLIEKCQCHSDRDGAENCRYDVSSRPYSVGRLFHKRGHRGDSEQYWNWMF